MLIHVLFTERTSAKDKHCSQKSDKHFTKTAVNMLALMYFIIFR